VGCVPYVVIESCGVQVGEGKSVLSFFKEECKEGVWSGCGESKV